MSTAEESSNSREVDSPTSDSPAAPAEEAQRQVSEEVAPAPVSVLLDEKTGSLDATPDETNSVEEVDSAELMPIDESSSHENDEIDSLMDEATQDQAMVPDFDFQPPSIPGMRSEITKPLNLKSRSLPSEDDEEPVEIPPNAANPEMISNH